MYLIIMAQHGEKQITCQKKQVAQKVRNKQYSERIKELS